MRWLDSQALSAVIFEGRDVTEQREPDNYRLAHHASVFRFCAGYWLRTQAIYEDEQRFLPGRALTASLDLRAGFHLCQPGRAGSDWHGCFRREIWYCYEPFLLDRRHSCDDLCRRLHDAFLLRIKGALGA